MSYTSYNKNGNVINHSKTFVGWLWNAIKKGAKSIIGKQNTASLTDVMDEDGNFIYQDNSTGLTKLWNSLTGKTQQDMTIAQNNWNTQYNDPSAQAERLTEAGYNPNLVNGTGLYEATQTPVTSANPWNSIEGLGNILNGMRQGSDFFLDRKKKQLENKNLTIRNIADELNLPPVELTKAIKKAQDDPSYVQEKVRQMLTDLNLNATAQQNQGDKLELEGEQTKTQYLLNALEKAFAEDDVKTYTETNPYSDTGEKRLNLAGREQAGHRRDAKNADYIIRIAEKTKALAEEAWSKTEGHNGAYPTWGVDLLDDSMMKTTMNALDGIKDPTFKAIVTSILFVLRKKL